MELIPSVRWTRFEQIDPGDLFFCIDRNESFYGIKTAARHKGDRDEMVILGPGMIEQAKGSMILPWDSFSVLSLGKAYSILLSGSPSAWTLTRPQSSSVCLAIFEDKPYIVTNGGPSPDYRLTCFVDIENGEVLSQLPYSVYTDTWEIVIVSERHPPSAIIRYPLQIGR